MKTVRRIKELYHSFNSWACHFDKIITSLCGISEQPGEGSTNAYVREPHYILAYCFTTLDNRLKMSSSEGELTNQMEVEGSQFEPEFTEEESESQNLASSPIVIVSMKEECHWIVHS